ncbi:MAG: pyruvate kinase [Candidatus Poribacteria bacterium]|nr:pyruvate kinase [Candidatus Poribacteria bacterium]MDE0503982.1 pyruvate kinase [Candidatus Poribacteria bacterium]
MTRKRTKIVCTLGSASNSTRKIHALIDAGMDIARLSFAHGSHEEHADLIARVRQVSKQRQMPLPILQDLSGPKLRIGTFANPPVKLTRGSRFTLTTQPQEGNLERVSITCPELVRDAKPGDSILLADGEIELSVASTTETDATCEVVVGGELGSNKGISAPSVALNQAIPTPKDTEDVIFGIEHGVDWVAQSFVRSAEELHALRDIIRQHGGNIPIIAKLEKREALDNLDEIIEAADGVMIARGDLGLEIPLQEVPIVQKQITRASNRSGKPVITATHMLDSMINNPRPTRAEVTDVANAIFDGTDAIMLSGETAVGKYPVKATRMMTDVALATEAGLDFTEHLKRERIDEEKSIPSAIAHAACHIALAIRAKVIICCTQSEQDAKILAKYRPSASIVVSSWSESTLRRALLSWSTSPTLIERSASLEQSVENAKAAVLESGIAERGDRAVIVAGMSTGLATPPNAIDVEIL